MSEQQPQVTIQTLANVLQIIDVCTKRGAFQGTELASVGKTYNEINNFVKAVQAQQELNKVESSESTEETNAEAVNDTSNAEVV